MINPDARLKELADVQVLIRDGNGLSPPPGWKNAPGGAASAGPQPLPFTAWGDIERTTEPQDFVEGLLLATTMSVIFGEPGAGKSFFAADLAMHVAAGRQWRDREVDAGAVIYVALEGSSGFMNRAQAAKREMDFPPEMPFALVTTPINMLDPAADVHRVIATIRAAAKQFGLPVSLIVIDTLARALAGGNENGPEDMGAFVLNCDKVRFETGAHVMAVHHSGKDATRGARGHNSLKGAVDTEIELTRDASSRVATVIKQRDLPEGDRFPFSLRVVEIGTDRRGKPITTAVVEHDQTPAAPALKPVRPRSRAETDRELVLRAIQDLLATPGLPQTRVPMSGMPTLATITRDDLRGSLRGSGFFDTHADGTLTQKDRDRLREALNSLKVQGKVAMTDRLVWLT